MKLEERKERGDLIQNPEGANQNRSVAILGSEKRQKWSPTGEGIGSPREETTPVVFLLSCDTEVELASSGSKNCTFIRFVQESTR